MWIRYPTNVLGLFRSALVIVKKKKSRPHVTEIAQYHPVYIRKTLNYHPAHFLGNIKLLSRSYTRKLNIIVQTPCPESSPVQKKKSRPHVTEIVQYHTVHNRKTLNYHPAHFLGNIRLLSRSYTRKLYIIVHYIR